MAVRTLSETSVGDELEPLVVHLDRARLVQYAGASLDRNPIHWDERFATSVGLPDVIAHGMLTMGVAGEAVARWAGDAGRILDYQTKFAKPVVVPYAEGTDLEVTGTVKRLDEDARTATVELTVTCQGVKVLARTVALVRLD